MQKFTGIAFDSSLVKKGYLFIAVKGVGHDGHDFIKDALKKGQLQLLVKGTQGSWVCLRESNIQRWLIQEWLWANMLRNFTAIRQKNSK